MAIVPGSFRLFLSPETNSNENTSSAEMVIEQDCGWVCDNDQQALERVLHGLLADKESLRKKKLQIQSRHMSNSAARKQFDDLVEE